MICALSRFCCRRQPFPPGQPDACSGRTHLPTVTGAQHLWRRRTYGQEKVFKENAYEQLVLHSKGT